MNVKKGCEDQRASEWIVKLTRSLDKGEIDKEFVAQVDISNTGKCLS